MKEVEVHPSSVELLAPDHEYIDGKTNPREVLKLVDEALKEFNLELIVAEFGSEDMFFKIERRSMSKSQERRIASQKGS